MIFIWNFLDIFYQCLVSDSIIQKYFSNKCVEIFATIFYVKSRNTKGIIEGMENRKQLTNSWEQHLKLITYEQHGPHQKIGGRLRCSGRVSNLCCLQDTRHVAHVKSSMRKGKHQRNRSIFIWETVFIRPSNFDGTYYGIQMSVRPSVCLSIRRKHIASYLENAWCDLIQTSHISLLWWSYGLYNFWWTMDFSFQSYGTSFVKLKAIFHMAHSSLRTP